jgi:putative ABC transport system permease protein
MKNLGKDLCYAWRLWRRAPAFAAVVVLTVALAVGAGTAVFSVVHGVLRPLPYPESDRLVSLTSRNRGGGETFGVTPGDFVRWRQRARSFSRLAARRNAALSFALPGEPPERIAGWGATEGYFDLLGCPPLLGRLLRDSDYAPGAPAVAVLSRGLWRRRLGGDPRAVGRTVLLDGQPAMVVGVLNERIEEALGDVWRPAVPDPLGPERESWVFIAIGRLAPGVSVTAAQREMEAVALELDRHRAQSRSYGVSVVSLREHFRTEVHRDRIAPLLTAASCLFLVACANLTSLSFAWISWRRREIAIRAALGAVPGRIVGQLLTEVLVLALTGGVLGVLFAAVGLHVLLGLNPGAVPPIAAAVVDGPALLVGLSLSLVAGVAVAVWPALDAARPALRALLSGAGGGRREGAPARLLGGALIAVEVAAAFVLLTGAGLSLRGFVNLSAVDPGFRAERRLTARVTLPERRYGERGASAFYTALAERLRASPGVEAVGVLSSLPTNTERIGLEFFVKGQIAGPAARRVSVYRAVTPGTLAVLGVPLVAGRDLTAADGPGAPWVALVNESLARRVWPGRSPVGQVVGQIIGIPQENGTLGRTTVVGVVADFRNRLDEETDPEMYLPFGQWATPEAMVILRTTAEPKTVERALRAAVRSLDPGVPVDPAVPFTRVVSESLSPFRFGTAVVGLYAGLALALSAVGVYGVISYSVARRRREIALRMAVGARRRDILWMVCEQTLVPTLAGLATGISVSLAAGRLVAGQLFGVSPTDPAVFLTVFAVLLGAALFAAAEPALCASGVDPGQAMR